MYESLINKTKERVFIDESRPTGRILNLDARPFLLEVDGGTSYLDRCKRDQDLPIYLYGIVQSGDKPNRNGRIYPWQYLKRECIRYMENEIQQGLSYGECFAEGHKILTKDKGWVDFRDLTEDAVVATMNPKTKEFEWQQILRKVEYEYEGDMVKLKSNSIDTLVTPNHKFWVSKNTKPLEYKETYAKDLNSSHLIPQHSVWVKESPEFVVLENQYGKLELETKNFAKFMGWYIAEGWFYINEKNSTWIVSISQSKPEEVEEIKKVIESLGLKYTITIRTHRKTVESVFSVSNKVLSKYLSQFGKSQDKYISEEIKNLSSEDIELFLETYFKGDGWGIEGRIHKMCATVSENLAEDLLELFQKTGTHGKITKKEQYATYYIVKDNNTGEEKEILDLVYYTHKEYTDNKEDFEIIDRRREYRGTYIYIVSRKRKTNISVADSLKGKEYYKGKVYCAEVPNHIIYVMNNGISFWSKNCDHPEESTTPALTNACWTVEDISFKGTDVYAKIKVLNAYMPDSAKGKLVRGFILNGKSVGVSSRALGSLEQYSNSEYDIVADDLEMICWDCVSNASNFGSETLEIVGEGTNRLVKNKHARPFLTESKLREVAKKSLNTSNLILTEEEKIYLNILGVEKFLRVYKQV